MKIYINFALYSSFLILHFFFFFFHFKIKFFKILYFKIFILKFQPKLLLLHTIITEIINEIPFRIFHFFFKLNAKFTIS